MYKGVNTQEVLMAWRATYDLISPNMLRAPKRYEKSFLMPRQATERRFFGIAICFSDIYGDDKTDLMQAEAILCCHFHYGKAGRWRTC